MRQWSYAEGELPLEYEMYLSWGLLQVYYEHRNVTSNI